MSRRRLNCGMGRRGARGSRHIRIGTNAVTEEERIIGEGRVSQGRLQSNVWEDLIKSEKYLSCLARRG